MTDREERIRASFNQDRELQEMLEELIAQEDQIDDELFNQFVERLEKHDMYYRFEDGRHYFGICAPRDDEKMEWADLVVMKEDLQTFQEKLESVQKILRKNKVGGKFIKDLASVKYFFTEILANAHFKLRTYNEVVGHFPPESENSPAGRA